MDFEKKYKVALETARALIANGSSGTAKIALEATFPELRMSEDEKVRQWLIRMVRLIEVDKDICADQETINKAIAWLEKQKEQEPMAWSKKQDDIIGYIRHILNDHAFEHNGLDVNGDYCTDEYAQADDFLNFLCPSWKPSEEQMKALAWYSGNYDIPPTGDKAIKSLYEDLKKLMEE